MNDDRTPATDSGTGDEQTSWSRRRFLNTGLATGLGAAALGACSTVAAQDATTTSVPSVEEAVTHLSHPDPSEETIALYRYLHDEWGERVLSGQQYEPWGVDEMDHIESVTGQRPAVQGADFIHDDKSQATDQALEWWDQGGITSIMWHWGVPGQETPEDEYDQSRNTGVQIDLQQILQEGTEPNQEFWAELAEVADELETLRDAGVPIIWRPFHEFEGQWFWWGVEGADFFVELWETMHEYYVHERDLDNLIWLLPHTGNPNPNWVPDESTFDLWGGDTYSGGTSYQWLYDDVVSVHGEDRPIIMHEIGRDDGATDGQPPDPDAVPQDGAWWSMWINWHTSWLTNIEDSYLDHVYNHELTVTLEDVPDIVAEYGGGGGGGGGDPDPDPDPESCRDFGEFSACDTNDDGLYRDFNGDDDVTTSDVVEFFEHVDSDGIQHNVEYFDYTDSGEVTTSDVVELFQYVSSS
ncbi:glycosyl hydrolase [Natronoglomus mannanivorans]|uniref:Glycoside hydrolase family 26 protein n=1 Tax=Natronoglomus mannanivorans TaxID=2979990 RepID=A0AAP3E3W3_9EURY|nr:glycoside hydrolase family 26 protein [Halobacteria archaeon AArc-xg1-1]